MFRLKTTLVARAVVRPWRTGWSADRGVDFSLAAPGKPAAAFSDVQDNTAPSEPACFIDEDRAVSPAAVQAAVGPPPEDAPGSPGLRAWSSLAGKPPRT